MADPRDSSPDVAADRVDADKDGAEQKGRTESLDDREILAQQAKQQRADARAGKSTGVTGELGRLEITGTKDAGATQLASNVQRDAAGHVTRVDYPDGVKKFDYSADGQLNKTTDDNGWSWRRENDGGWQLYNSNGERTETRLQGDIQVDSQGNFIFRNTNGMQEISRPDGTYRREYPNGASFERDAHNHVTSITDKNGMQTFEYGADGKLTRQTYPDGSSWRRENDGWHLYDGNGQRTAEKLQGDIEVDAQGNYIFKHTNGTRETSAPDGSYIRNEPNGEVSRVTYPDGTNKSFTYGPDGRLDSYTDQNGWAWRRENDGWHLYDDRGQRKSDVLQGDIEMDRQGNFTFVHRDGTRETTKPDGTVSRIQALRAVGR